MRHRELMSQAIERDAEGQRALFAGDDEAAYTAFAAAADLYRESWLQAPPDSYGRLVGMLKSAVLADDSQRFAEFAAWELERAGAVSPVAAYARAITALIAGNDDGAQVQAAEMRRGSDALARTAAAVEALARRDRAGYETALAAVVQDFEQRSEHLTGVAIADTALMLERLAASRGLAAGLRSPLLPPRKD